jgi:hypothetical protein
MNLMIWTLVVAISSSTPGPVAADLVGTWRYVGEVDRHADGTLAPVAPKAGYEGLLIYTANGYVTAQIYPKARGWEGSSATTDQLKETFDLSTSYFGTYTVDGSTGEVTHHILAALDPSGTGWDDRKQFTLADDRLVLKGVWELRGEKIKYEVAWQRVR